MTKQPESLKGESNKTIIDTYIRLLNNCTLNSHVYALFDSLEVHLLPNEWRSILSHILVKHGRVRLLMSRLLDLAASNKLVQFNCKFSLGHLERKLARDARRKILDRVENKSWSSFTRESKRFGFTHLKHSERVGNSVLIVWTGRAGRPMMPLATFVGSVALYKTDVVILRAPKSAESYLGGVGSLGNSLKDTIAQLGGLIADWNYSDIFVLGASMGTPPALICSAYLKPARVLLAGPIDPNSQYASDLEDFVQSREKLAEQAHISIAVGDFATADQAAATFISNLTGAKIIKIPAAGHNPLWPLVESGQFGDWMGRNLFNDLDSQTFP